MLAHRLGQDVARLNLFAVLALGLVVWLFAFIGMLDVARTLLGSAQVPVLPLLAGGDELEHAAVPGLPVFPGATCTEFRAEVFGAEHVTEIEYVVERDVPEVHAHYRAALERGGWTLTDTAWVHGELVLRIESGARAGAVELENRDGLTEIEIELIEPVRAGSR